MEVEEIQKLRQQLGVTRKEFAKIMNSSLAALNRWEQGSASVSPRKSTILEALKELVNRLDERRARGTSASTRAHNSFRSVLVEMGAENFFLLLAKDHKECLTRSCWRRLSAAIPSIGLVLGAPVGALGTLLGSPELMELLETLGHNPAADHRNRK